MKINVRVVYTSGEETVIKGATLYPTFIDDFLYIPIGESVMYIKKDTIQHIYASKVND